MPTTSDSIGRVLSSRYRIESVIGAGASAQVYAAWDVSLQRRVAVKVLHPALVCDSAFLRRFRSEAQSAAALAHPHVLAVFDWGEDDGGPFLVLEFLGGGSLRDMFDDGRRMSSSQAVSIGIAAAEGLAFAHGRGFVHRDIKPANLLFDTEGRLRVADFGLARALAEAALTEPIGTTVGTARYAAPEQALGNPVDGRADVYALALVLYEAVTGVVPFTSDTTFSTLMGRVGAKLPEHDGLGPLAGVLDAATDPELEQRLEAAGLANRLRSIATTLPAPEPLPLALVDLAAHRVGAIAASPDRDATWHPPTAGPIEYGLTSGMGNRSAIDADVLDLAAAVGVAKGSSVRTGNQVKRTRRRWFWIVATVALVAVLAVGGAIHTKVFTPSHRVVSVAGLTVGRAMAELHAQHFSMRVVSKRSSTSVPDGVIVRMVPAAGTSMKEGSVVDVVVSTGPPLVIVPGLAGVTGGCAAVTSMLAAANLKITCQDQNSTSVAQGTVIDWNPKGRAPLRSTVTVHMSSGPPPVTVPSLTGVTGGCAPATSILAAANLKITCQDQNSTSVAQGTVIDWSPKGQAAPGSTVTVVVSEGPVIETIPSLRGSTCTGATTTLGALGLHLKCTNQYSATVPKGQVISWSPTGTAAQGTVITAVISGGPAPVAVPDVIGMRLSGALSALQKAGLVAGNISGPGSGLVTKTLPAAGTSVPTGTSVNLTMQ